MTGLSLDPLPKQLINPSRVIDPHLVARTEWCACGSLVQQLTGEDEATAVRRHQATRTHDDWSLATFPQGGSTSTAVPVRVDVSASPTVRSVPALRRRGAA